MLSALLKVFGGVILVFGGLVACADPAPSLPADNPYAPAYAALARLTPEDRDALNAGKPASAAALPILAEITRSLAVGRQATAVDWGMDSENVDSRALDAFRVSRILRSETEQAPAPAFIDLSIDTLALGRSVGRDGPLESLLVQLGIESAIDKSLQKNLSRLSPQDAGALLTQLKFLPLGGTLATAIQAERNLFVDRLSADIRQVIAQLTESEPTNENFAAHLRMAGILTDGSVTTIGLEQGEDSFWLKPNETKRGITLLSVDRSHDEALLAHDGQMARIHLAAHTIIPINFAHFEEAINALPESSKLRRYWFASENASKVGEIFLRGMDLTNREIGDLYTEALTHPENFTEGPAYEERMKKLSPLAQNAAIMLPRFIRYEKENRDRQAKLLADLSAIANPSVQR